MASEKLGSIMVVESEKVSLQSPLRLNNSKQKWSCAVFEFAIPVLGGKGKNMARTPFFENVLHPPLKSNSFKSTKSDKTPVRFCVLQILLF